MAQPSRQQRKRGVVMYMAAAVIAAVWVILQRTMASDEVYLQLICIPMPVMAALLAIRAANVMGHRKRVGYVGDDWGHRKAAP